MLYNNLSGYLKDKYGKNSILKCMNYFERSTARARNKMVGGHNGE